MRMTRLNSRVGAVALLTLFVVACVSGLALRTQNKEDDHLLRYKDVVEESSYIKHALGTLDGRTYLNIVNSAEVAYSKGARLFEVDVSLTSDGRPVLSHGWSKKDYKERLGWQRDDNYPIPSYEDFMSRKLWGKYETNDITDLLRFMQRHNDAYMLIDVGRLDYGETKEIYTTIVREVKDSLVLSRFIVGGHSTDAIEAVKDVYDFKLYNLYYANDGVREANLGTPEKFIRYAEDNNISSMSIAAENYTPELARTFRDSSLITYIFTIDDIDEANMVRSLGASVVGTNFLE